jgi:hypothetical protein
MATYVYPLDKTTELRRRGWDTKELIAEAKDAGYVITRELIKAWADAGMLPPADPHKPWMVTTATKWVKSLERNARFDLAS